MDENDAAGASYEEAMRRTCLALGADPTKPSDRAYVRRTFAFEATVLAMRAEEINRAARTAHPFAVRMLERMRLVPAASTASARRVGA